MMTATIKEEILSIRDSGAVNMLDVKGVQSEAFHSEYYDLVCYLEENPKEYWNFIMTGEAPMEDDK